MNMAKRIGFGILCAFSALIVLPTNASSYGSRPSRGLTEFNNVPPRDQLKFATRNEPNFAKFGDAKKRKSDNNEENDIKRQKIEEEDNKENALLLAAIQKRVTCADDHEFPIQITTLELENQERNRRQFREYRDECKKNGDDKAFFESLTLSQKEQIELSKRRAIKGSQIRLEDLKRRKEEIQKQREANPIVIKPAQSEYGKNIQKFTARKNSEVIPTGPLNEFVFHLAEENFDHAALTARFNKQGFSFFAPTAALLHIGDSRPVMQQNPQQLYDMLHSEPMGEGVSAAQVNKCALYFAKKAGNKRYLNFAKSIDQ